MAKLIVSILSSLDGYCAGSGGTLAGLPMDAAFDLHNLDCMRRAGTLLFGATTFPMFEAYWPQVDRGPASDPVQREIAERMFQTPWRLQPLRANGQPAFACYIRQVGDDRFRPGGVVLLRLRGGLIEAIDSFIDPAVCKRFGMADEFI